MREVPSPPSRDAADKPAGSVFWLVVWTLLYLMPGFLYYNVRSWPWQRETPEFRAKPDPLRAAMWGTLVLGILFLGLETPGQMCARHDYDYAACVFGECGDEARAYMQSSEFWADAKLNSARTCANRCRACVDDRPTPAFPRAFGALVGLALLGVGGGVWSTRKRRAP